MNATAKPTDSTPLTIRKMIGLYIETIRECRTDRKYPTLHGAGFAVANGLNGYQKVQGGYNMAGSWNRGTEYNSKETAEKRAEFIRSQRPELGPLRVIHINQFRDETEALALEMLRHLLPHRHKAI